MTAIARQIFESAPISMRTRPPIARTVDDLRARVAYFQFWLQKADEGLEKAYSEGPEAVRFWQRFKRANEKRVKAAQKFLSSARSRDCCGLLLTRSEGNVGPECSKHPDKFPCKLKRRRRICSFLGGQSFNSACLPG
jgi:hypothetical protein